MNIKRNSDALAGGNGERELLYALVVGLWYEIDQEDGTGASAFFTPDATLTFENASFKGTSEIDGVYATRTKRGPRVSRHLLTNFHLTALEGEEAAAISSLLLFAEDGVPPSSAMVPLLVADVADTFQRIEGRWLISSRKISNLFIAPTSELAVPTQ